VERLVERDPVKLQAEFLTHRARMQETVARLKAEQARRDP